jgi:DNA polymerase-4
MTERLIFHLDMDAFFAAVEQAANPNWQKRPVVVCGDGRTVVATASYEARRHGIHSGQPMGEAKRLAPPETVFIPGHHQKYLWISLQIFNMLAAYTPLVEPCSIDEAFMDVTGNPEAQADPVALARRIKGQIASEFKLTCSIGIAGNKLIAKMASDAQKPNGLTWITPEETIDWLHNLPIERLPGVGPSTTAYLQGLNIRTIGELALIDEGVLIGWFGKNGSHLYKMAWGREEGLVTPELPELKSVSQEWTLPRDSADRDEIEAALFWLSGLVGRRLRSERQGGRTVTLKLRDAGFHTIARSQTVSRCLCLDTEIRAIAAEILGRNWRGEALRLLGVRVSNLVKLEEGPDQPGLWFDSKQRDNTLIKTVDRLKNKYGEEALVWATSLALAQRGKHA